MLYCRVLITGANGLVGQELVHRLSELPEYDVLATGRAPQPRFEASCGYAPLDVTDEEAAHRLFQDFTPNVVVNLAAMTNVDTCETEKQACWAANADAVKMLARLSHRHGARLVQVSTDFVFSGEHGPGKQPLYKEKDRPAPVNYYAKSKLAGENAARDAGRDRWAIARPALIFGMPDQTGRSNIVLWVVEKLSRGEKIKVVTDQWRTPTYAPDFAIGLEKLIRYGKAGIFHLSGRDYLSVFDFARLIAHTFDLDASLIEPTDATQFSQPARRPARTGLLILKAETELGYHPRPLESALRHLGQRLGLIVTD